MGPTWQVKIDITQAPQPFYPDPFDENAILEWHEPENFRTILYDPLVSYPPRWYGLEITANQRLDVSFICDAESEMKSLEIGNAWLASLRFRFKGLDGKLTVKKGNNLDSKDEENEIMFETILPRGILKRRINIIQKFVNLFYQKFQESMHLLILWQRGEEDSMIDTLSNVYGIKILFYCENINPNTEQYSIVRGMLNFLISEIETKENEIAYLKEVVDYNYIDVLKGNFVKDKSFFNKFIIKEEVNLDFPDDLPLPKIPILENENVRYIDLDKEFIKKSISIGYHIKNGVLTEHITYTPINTLVQDIGIFGKSGTGKTYFLARLIKELVEKTKNVGILVLNVAKESQGVYYQDFRILKYLDEDFHVPYYIEGRSLEKSVQETASYICASLGLKNVFEKIIYRTMQMFLRTNHELPEFFIELLLGVEKYVQQNPYGEDTQANLAQALRNRIKVFDEDRIQNVMKLTKDLPEWILSWLKGENIFLDLAECNKFTKMLIVNAILQIIRTITKDIEIEELKHVIVIDEAHAILEKPITHNSDDADFILKEAMAKIISELLKEYRSRGVGIILADQSPSRLFDEVVSQPSIRVVFREDYPNNTLFSENPIERQILTQLPNRTAKVGNGATGENYLINSLDFSV